MQRYLQSGELSMLDLQSFDSWIGMFAERVTEFEVDIDTSTYRLATRFAKFHNLPELTSLLSSVADFHQVDESADIPAFDGYNDALVSKTPAFAAYLADISTRADDVRNRRISRKDDNMLKITTDGRKAALDLRLVDPMASFTYQSKVARCSENVADIYFKTSADKSTQIIFCDTSTPKAVLTFIPNSRTDWYYMEFRRAKLLSFTMQKPRRRDLCCLQKSGAGISESLSVQPTSSVLA